jgi:hypothetical protein
MSFNALVQDGKVYLVPASIEVPVARRKAVLPVEALGSWSQVPAAAVTIPVPAPIAPLPPLVEIQRAPEPAAPLPEVKEQNGERRKGR